jgi:hypothetical protein
VGRMAWRGEVCEVCWKRSWERARRWRKASRIVIVESHSDSRLGRKIFCFDISVKNISRMKRYGSQKQIYKIKYMQTTEDIVALASARRSCCPISAAFSLKVPVSKIL